MSSDSDIYMSDVEEEVPLRDKRKAAKKGDSAYKIRGALKVPRATTFTCQALYEQIHGQDIDLQPEYQRAVVWPDVKQIGLIDSIFRNFYVPPVIFVVNTSDEGAERRVCVDGKQRLTSIYRFIGGEIPYKDAFTGEKFVFKDTGKIKAQVLPANYRKLFMNKQIVCMEYQDITTANEREIFQRVQLGMALTPAEKLQAITGPRAEFVRELLDTYVVDQLASQITWDTSRANDFRGLVTAVLGISKWPHLNTLPSFSAIEAWLQDPEELEEDFCDDVQHTFRIFCELAKDSALSKPFWLAGIKKVAPMEVIAVAILIHANKKKMTMAQLSETIGLLRMDVRKTEKDIRQNTRTMKTFLTFLKDIKVPKPEPGVLTAYKQVKRATKRKRTKKEMSDDDAPPPRPSRSNTILGNGVSVARAAVPPPPRPALFNIDQLGGISSSPNPSLPTNSPGINPFSPRVPIPISTPMYHLAEPRQSAYQSQPAPSGDTGPSWTRK